MRAAVARRHVSKNRIREPSVDSYDGVGPREGADHGPPQEGGGGQHGHGTIKQQLRHGIFTSNPRFWESMSYVMFVCVFTWVVFNSQGTSSYMMTSDIYSTFSGFEELSDISGWWDFHENTLSGVVFPNAWYNGQTIEDSLLRNVNGKYALIGAVAVRQQRVKSDSCEVRKRLSTITSICHADIKKSTEDRSPYGPTLPGTTNLAYQYKTAKELGCKVGCMYLGYFGVYQGGGFVETLPSERSNQTLSRVLDKFNSLKDGLWIDEQTRVLFTEFTVYNIPKDLVAAVTLSLEFSAAGAVKPFIKITPIKIGHIFASEGSNTELAAEALVLVMVLGYTLQALYDWRKKGKAYWKNSWHYFDWVNFFLFYAAFGFRYGAIINGGALDFPPSDNTFVYISGVGNSVEMWKMVMGANSFMTWFKIFKYFSHIPFMARLIKVLGAASEDSIAFLICLLVVDFGFVLTFYLTYGSYVEDFSTLTMSFYSSYRIMLGDWDFGPLYKYNSLLGPIYFIMFTGLAIFILANMFVAIIMEGYFASQYDAVTQEEEKVSILQFVASKMAAVGVLDSVAVEGGRGGDSNEDDEGGGDSKEGEFGRISSAAAAASGVDAAKITKIGEDMELVLAALVDFRKDLRSMAKRVSALSDTGTGIEAPRRKLAPERDPGFLE